MHDCDTQLPAHIDKLWAIQRLTSQLFNPPHPSTPQEDSSMMPFLKSMRSSGGGRDSVSSTFAPQLSLLSRWGYGSKDKITAKRSQISMPVSSQKSGSPQIRYRDPSMTPPDLVEQHRPWIQPDLKSTSPAGQEPRDAFNHRETSASPPSPRWGYAVPVPLPRQIHNEELPEIIYQQTKGTHSMKPPSAHPCSPFRCPPEENIRYTCRAKADFINNEFPPPPWEIVSWGRDLEKFELDSVDTDVTTDDEHVPISRPHYGYETSRPSLHFPQTKERADSPENYHTVDLHPPHHHDAEPLRGRKQCQGLYARETPPSLVQLQQHHVGERLVTPPKQLRHGDNDQESSLSSESNCIPLREKSRPAHQPGFDHADSSSRTREATVGKGKHSPTQSPPQQPCALTHLSARMRPKFPSTAPPATHEKPYRRYYQLLLEAEYAFDTRKLLTSIEIFTNVHPQEPKILFNIGQLHMWARDYIPAYTAFLSAIELDCWFLPAWVQLGFIDFIEMRYELAEQRWKEAFRCFRGSQTSDWEQLGLMWQGQSHKVMWNRAAAAARERGGRPSCIPQGAIFRIPGRFAKAANMEAGQNTEWMFAGKGKEIARRQSLYEN